MLDLTALSLVQKLKSCCSEQRDVGDSKHCQHARKLW